MPFIAGYVAIAAVFAVLDAVWLTFMGRLVYRPTLGDILLSEIRYGPAIAFYLMFPLAVLIFGSLAGARSGGLLGALLYGALFGAFAYATYDLTNFATLRNWTLQITVIDIVYGALLSAVAAAAGYAAFRAAGG
jgi:uncharacterized membrane protein